LTARWPWFLDASGGVRGCLTLRIGFVAFLSNVSK
jgi:hypothetical protein